MDSGLDSGHDAGFDSGTDSGTDSGFDAGMVPDGGWAVASHYPMPQVISYGGAAVDAPNGVLASPVFTAVTYSTYDLTTEAQDFVATVGTIPYWSEAVGEYGVGTPTVGTPVVLPSTETAPTTIDDSQIQTWLATQLNGSNAAFGTPTSESVYFITYPTGTTVTLDGSQSCVEGGFGGYHNSVALTSGPWAGLNVSYAVLPECSIDATTAESLTQAGSHELVEATTDPLPQTETPTYVQVDQADFVWEAVLGGGEVADMCAQNYNAFFEPSGYPYSVQRIWSNAHAAAGHDPCQPSQPGVYFFNATAQMNANVQITFEGQAIETEGLSIPIGQSQTVDVNLYSDGPVADWTVQASDTSENGSGTYLDFSWDSTTGNNGTTLHLTITPIADNTMFGGEPFIIYSVASMTSYNYWIGFVGN
jgi:hypothetical protein